MTVYMQIISGVNHFAVAIIDNKLHSFVYFKSMIVMKRYKDLHCCEVIIKIYVRYTVLHTSEDTVKLLTCFLIQCLHVCVDMWLKCLAAGRMVFTVKRTCHKHQTWESGWLPVQTIFLNSAACVIDYHCWGIILFKSCHDDIKNNTRAFTLKDPTILWVS